MTGTRIAINGCLITGNVISFSMLSISKNFTTQKRMEPQSFQHDGKKSICNRCFPLESNVKERRGASNRIFHEKNSNLKTSCDDEKTHTSNHSDKHHRAIKIRMLRGHPPQLNAKILTFVEHVSEYNDRSFT